MGPWCTLLDLAGQAAFLAYLTDISEAYDVCPKPAFPPGWGVGILYIKPFWLLSSPFCLSKHSFCTIPSCSMVSHIFSATLG